MGLFDDDVRDGFDAMFDFDRDGKLDLVERGMQFEFLEEEDRAFRESISPASTTDDRDE